MNNEKQGSVKPFALWMIVLLVLAVAVLYNWDDCMRGWQDGWSGSR